MSDVVSDFFQAGQTYQRRRWLFQCLAVAPDPFDQSTRAVGFLYRHDESATATALGPDDWAHAEWLPVPAPYCTGDRCADCDEECCEATCGCCPIVNEHGHCFLRPGAEEDSKYCNQHGEGSLFGLSPAAQRRYDILRQA